MDFEDMQFTDWWKKNFEFKEEKISFKELYKKLDDKKSPFTSLYYSSPFSSSKVHVLIDKYNRKNVFYFAKTKYILNLRDSQGKIENYEILSNYEIIEIIKEKNKNNIYCQDKKFSASSDYFSLNDSNIINLYYDNEVLNDLPLFSKENYIVTSEEIKPINLTQYYSLYFYDNPEKKLKFILTNERRQLIDEFTKCFNDGNKVFKFTGPSGIGKSFLLLYYSRTSFNIVYLNIAAMRYLEKEQKYNKIRNLLIEEFKRVNFDENEVKLFNNTIKTLSPFNINNILITLINFCKETKKEIIIILDQFKIEIDIDDIDLGNLSVIICSSVNDKKIRLSCINYLNRIINNEKIDYKLYFYIQKLYENKTNGNELYSYFGNIHKYILKIGNCKTYEEYLSRIDNIKKEIINKLEIFYNGENFYENIIKVKQNLDDFIDISKFNNIIIFYPLKYFRILFFESKNEENPLFESEIAKAKYFKMNYLFSFLFEVFEELISKVQKKFFTNGLFLDHTGSTIGGFFELVSIDAIKNKLIHLPNGPIQNILRVTKICNMDEIKPTLYQKIASMFIKEKTELENDKMEVEETEIGENEITEKSEIGGNEKLFEMRSIYKTLPEEIKNFYLNNYIYSENELIYLTNEYLKKYPNFVIDVDGESKYVFKINNKINTSKIVKIKNHNHSIKDETILITQEKENAEVFDLAYLYGPSHNKIFIGFQMKAYRDLEDKKERVFKLSKKRVIEKSIQLILNSRYLLDVEITEWHFVVVGLFFSEQEIKNFSLKKSYSENLINFCREKELQLILYNPIIEKFYNSNKKVISKLTLNKLSKLGGETIKLFKFEEKCESLGNKNILERCLESEIFLKDVVDNNISKETFYHQMENFNNIIKKHLKINFLSFVGLKNYNKNDNFIPIPNDNTLLIFKKRNNRNKTGLESICIYLKYPQNKPKVYIFEGESLSKLDFDFDIQYFNLFDLKSNYYVFVFE